MSFGAVCSFLLSSKLGRHRRRVARLRCFIKKKLWLVLIVVTLSLLFARTANSTYEKEIRPTPILDGRADVDVRPETPQTPDPGRTEGNQEPNLAEDTSRNTPDENRKLGYMLLHAYGWGEYWSCFDKLVMKESGYNHLIWNRAGSGAYGIPQALPATKMATHGADYMTNPATQFAWMFDYIYYRYGNPCNALNFHYSHNWY